MSELEARHTQGAEAMTPLEKAEAAMVTELVRQRDEGIDLGWVDADNPRAVIVDGTVDLHALARAVIEAIREPSEGMVDAVVGPPVQFPVDPQAAAQQMLDAMRAATTWQTMIDAALSEIPE